MRLVIDIPESEIPKKQDIIEITLHFIDGKVCEAGGYGFVLLPKGHGRLIDADAFERRCMFDSDIEDMQDVIYALRDYKPIIEADKEQEK